MTESKRQRLRLGGPTLAGIEEYVQGADDRADFVAEMVDLERIEPDPNNPRRLGLTLDEVASLSDPDEVAVRRGDENLEPRWGVLMELRELADSIQANGVLQPIKIYRHGSGFRIAYGERRYWGAHIAGLRSIPALILAHRPARLRALQLVENVQRSDLDLPARVRNIAGVLEDLRGDGEASAPRLATMVGFSERVARRYVQVVKGPQEVREAIDGGTVTDLKTAAALVGLDGGARTFVLGRMAIGKSFEQACGEWEARQRESEAAMPTVGRPRTKVTLGSTKNVALVRVLMERICGVDALPDIRWDDYGAVAKAWQKLLVDIERSLQK
jgi:ParB family chromosome partitioning protein